MVVRQNEVTTTPQKTQIEPMTLQKGMMVRIVYLENSYYNYYKGYLGEIKSFSKNNEYAYIHLHACASLKIIHLPIAHFRCITDFTTMNI